MLNDHYSEWARRKRNAEEVLRYKELKITWHRKGFWTAGAYGADVYTLV